MPKSMIRISLVCCDQIWNGVECVEMCRPRDSLALDFPHVHLSFVVVEGDIDKGLPGPRSNIILNGSEGVMQDEN